jgi:hypothetical protein
MIDEDVHQRVKPLKLRAILEQYANGRRPAKKAAGAAGKPAKRPAGKKVAVGAVARPRGKPGNTAKRTVARKPAPRGKPVRVAAKRGARR